MSELSDILTRTDFEHISLEDLVHLEDSLSKFENTSETETLAVLKQKIADKYAVFDDRFAIHRIRTGYKEEGWGKSGHGVSPEDLVKKNKRSKRGWNPNEGWKFHLDVVPNRNHPVTKAVSEWLLDLGINHKIADGGENGKGMTVYVGSYDDIKRLAQEVQKRFGKDIYEPPVYTDQVKQEHAFESTVYGRFVPGENIGDYPIDGIGIGLLSNKVALEGMYFHESVTKAFELGLIKDVKQTVFPTNASHRARARAYQTDRESSYLLSYCSHKLYAAALGSYYCGTDIDAFEKVFFPNMLPAKGTEERKKWDEVAKVFVDEAKKLTYKKQPLFDYIKGFSNGYMPIEFSRLSVEKVETKKQKTSEKKDKLSSKELFILYNKIAEKVANKEQSGKDALKILQAALKSSNNNKISLDYFYSAAHQIIKSDPSLQSQVIDLAQEAWSRKENDQQSLRSAITFFGENKMTAEQTVQLLDKLPNILETSYNSPKTREYAYWLMAVKLFPNNQINPDLSKEDYKKSLSLLEREVKKENSKFGLNAINDISGFILEKFPEFHAQVSRLNEALRATAPVVDELGSLSDSTVEAGRNRIKEINKSIASASGDDLSYFSAEIDLILRDNPRLIMETYPLLNKMAASDKHNNISLRSLADTLITIAGKEPKLLSAIEKDMIKLVQTENLSGQSLFQIYGHLSEIPQVNHNAGSFVLNVISAGLNSNKNTADSHANAVTAITNSIVTNTDGNLSLGLGLLETISRSDKQCEASIRGMEKVMRFVRQNFPEEAGKVQRISENISRRPQKKTADDKTVTSSQLAKSRQKKVTAEEHIPAPTPKEQADALKNQNFKEPWRKFYQKAAVKENAVYSEDKDSAYYKATLSRTNGEKLEITATPQHKVSLGAKDKDGKSKVPSYEDFNNLVLAAKAQGGRISFGKIKTPEFRARLMLACLENDVDIKTLPEFGSMEGLEPETKQRLSKHKIAILKRMVSDKEKNGKYSGLSSEENLQRKKLEQAKQEIRQGRKNNQTDTPEYQAAKNMLLQRRHNMGGKV